ncbi:MAG: TolC family protein [Bacteroidia bacterium]|jgi:NodT family efflux transporter outer membrane factor (OMF) lipoprotein|nr:TolC family protein [Bacteroidia bacterium]GIV23715.1 MAG: RND transporter [Bacteroidia bacterium]
MKGRYRRYALFIGLWGLFACVGPRPVALRSSITLPARYAGTAQAETLSLANNPWQSLYTDPYLAALIDTALARNQELSILLTEIEIAHSEVKARTGEYLPFLSPGGRVDVDKVGRYTRMGAVEHTLEVAPGEAFPEPFSTYEIGAYAHWELDIWKRLRTLRRAALLRYLATIEGRRYAVTRLVAEIAETYYELLAVDNLLTTIDEYIQIQMNALQLMRLSKAAGKATQLAVNRFEARLLHTQNRRYALQQRRTELENYLNFLVGRLPEPLPRASQGFLDKTIDTTLMVGVPLQLLRNRPDLRQAELELKAAHLEALAAYAAFLPQVSLSGVVGMQAFRPAFLLSPESMLYQLAAEAILPWINRNALKAGYIAAKARQRQALLRYERTLIHAYAEVLNELAHIQNFSQSFRVKAEEVRLLTESIAIANNLYRAAEADYLEVLLTQVEALDARMELIETKLELLKAQIGLYRALGGGWQGT